MYGCLSGSCLAKPASMCRPAADQTKPIVARTNRPITTGGGRTAGSRGARSSVSFDMVVARRQRGISTRRTPPSPNEQQRARAPPGRGRRWPSGRAGPACGPPRPPRRSRAACPPCRRRRSARRRGPSAQVSVSSVPVAIGVQVRASVGRPEEVAAQPEGEQRPVRPRQQAEERALVRRRQRLPGGAPVVGPVEVARLRRQEERPVGGGGDLVQVEVVLAVHRSRRPGVAAVAGGEQPAVGADGQARARVGEPDVEQGLLVSPGRSGRAPTSAPPSRVRRTTSSWPTAQPSRASCMKTPVSSARVGDLGLASRTARRRARRGRARARRRPPGGRRAPPRRAAATRRPAAP